MPVMRHGDVELFESKAIATYLDRSFQGPALFPSEPLPAALAEQWVSVVNTLVDRTLVRTYLLAYAAPKSPDGKPDRQAIDAVTPALREQIEVLDKAVAKTGYLAGDQFTFADINLMPILYYVRMPPEGAEALSRAANLAAYYKRHAGRPSFVPHHPARRPAAPGDAELANNDQRVARAFSPRPFWTHPLGGLLSLARGPAQRRARPPEIFRRADNPERFQAFDFSHQVLTPSG